MAEDAFMVPYCERAVVAFFQNIDHKNFRGVAELFAGDGVWRRHADALTGPETIFEVISSRPETQRERHVVTNIHVKESAEDRCAVIAYVMTFRTDAAPDAGAVPVPGANGLADFQFGFRKIGKEWKIAALESRPVFVFKS